MSRNCKLTFATLALATLLGISSERAKANIFIDLQVDSASAGYTGAGQRSVAVTNSQKTFVLDVYALIAPNGTNTVDATKLGLSAIASNFFVANSTLKGDVSFQGWNTSGVSSINTVSSLKGTTYTPRILN